MDITYVTRDLKTLNGEGNVMSSLMPGHLKFFERHKSQKKKKKKRIQEEAENFNCLKVIKAI